MGKINVQKNDKHLMPRVIRTPRLTFRILCMTILCCAFNSPMALAIETTKASGLVLGKGQAPNSSLTSQNSCRKYLSSNYVSPKHSHDIGVTKGATVPVALGLFLGVRIALIPSPAPQKGQKLSRNVQIGPEIRGVSSTGNSYALAVAAYRKCQKEEFLKTGYKNK